MNFYSALYLILASFLIQEISVNLIGCEGHVISSPSISTQCLSQERVELGVNTIPVTVQPDICIEAHSLMVNVKDEKGDPLTNSIVILRSDNEINFENLPVSSDIPTIRFEINKWFYEWKPDSSGSILINCLPTGKYIINAKTIISNDIETNFDEKIVEMNSKITEITISLKSFNIFGNLFSTNRKPLEDVKIKLDGEIKSKSNEQGIFTLINVGTGKHILEAEKEYFEFDKLYIDLSSKIDKKIIFFPNRIAICGQIILADEMDQNPFELTSLDDNGFVHIYTNSEGKFCRLFPRGKYLLKPISPMFLPSQIQIDLNNGPVTNLKFFEHKTKSGPVSFLRQQQNDESTEKLLSILYGWGTLIASWVGLVSISLSMFGVICGLVFFVIPSIRTMKNDLNELKRNMVTRDDLDNILEEKLRGVVRLGRF